MYKKTMKGKRAAAIACAVAVGLSGFGMGGMTAQATAAGTTVSETGAMNYVDMSKYTQVLLPTSKTMAFALDPQGLSTMTGATADASTLAAAAGNIVSSGEVSVVNYGYYPLKVRANFYVTDTGKSIFVDKESDVDVDTAQNVYLTITPSSAKTTVTTETDATTSAVTITGTTGYTPAGESLAVTGIAAASAQGMVYVLRGADYEFTKDTVDGKDVYAAQLKTGGEYGAATFKIGGKLNKNANWAAYIDGKAPKTLKLNAVFSYTTMTEAEYEYLTAATDGFIEPGTYNKVVDTKPEVSITDFRMDPVKGATLPLYLGTGATASTIKTVELVKHTKTTNAGTETNKDTKVAIKNVTANSTGTAANLPAVVDVQNELKKVDKDTYFDPGTSEYRKIAYTDAKGIEYEINYDLVVTFADGTVSEAIPVTMIEYQAPTVAYTGAILAKSATAKANAAMAKTMFTVNLGNGGATKVTKIALNMSKSTASPTAVNDAMTTIEASGTEISLKANAFKYQSGAAETKIVYTITFDSGETADVEIPVAAN